LAVVEERSGFRPRAVRSRGVSRLVRRRISGLPYDFAGRGVERHHHLVAAATREGVDGLANDDGRRVTLSDLDLPSARQLLRPRFRRGERAGRTVAVPPAPLRIILRRVLSYGCCVCE